MIRFDALGSIELTDDQGTEILSVLAQPKRLALLAYLAFADPPGYHRRDELLALFWPDSEADRARTALRGALHYLRRSLGEDVLPSRGDEVGVDGDLLRTDVAAFREAVAEDRWSDAVELYRGDLLEAFHVDGAPEFERWLEAERVLLRTRAREAALTAAEAAERRGDLATAADRARRAVALAWDDEIALRRLVGLLDRAGDRAGAIMVYEEFARRLEEELEAQPAPETRALVEEVRAREQTRPTGSGPPAAPAARAVVGDPTSNSSDVPRPTRALRWTLSSAAAAILLLAGGVWWADRRNAAADTERTPDLPLRSVAVLPLESLYADDEDARRFAAGLTEDLQIRLSQISDLRVISLEAAAREAKSGDDLGEVGRRLGTRALVVGAVRREGDRARITVRLIDTRSGQNLWGDTYDRDIVDVFDVQAEIAVRVGAALEAELTADERRRVVRRPTPEITAWDYVVQARRLFNNPIASKDELELGMQLVEHALASDSTYAPAHALRVANLVGFMASGTTNTEVSTLDSALSVAKRAVALDPEHYLGYQAPGLALLYQGRIDDALAAFVRVLELNPNYRSAINMIALLHTDRGRLDESLLWYARGQLLDPSPAEVFGGRGYYAWVLGDHAAAERWFGAVRQLGDERPNLVYAQLLLTMGRLRDARAEVSRALGNDSDLPPARAVAALVDLKTGDYSSAAEWLEPIASGPQPARLLQYTGLGLVTSTAHAFARAELGDGAGAERLLRASEEFDHEVIARSGGLGHARYDLARVHAIRGDIAEANRWLARAIEHGWTYAYTHMGRQDPMLEALHGSPEFERLMGRLEDRLDVQRARVEQATIPPTDAEFAAMLDALRARVGDRRPWESSLGDPLASSR